METLLQLYKDTFGYAPASIQQLDKAGSNRTYIRFTAPDGTTCIGVIGLSQTENDAFIYLTRHFHRLGLNVPELIAVSDAGCCYLQTDLGTQSLYQALSKGRTSGNYSQEERALLAKTLRALAHLQVKGATDLDFSQLIPPVRFDKMAATFDLNYFKYCFLRTTGVPYDEVALEHDFEQFANALVTCATASPNVTFLYRDFQARNVMLKDGEPYFIDYQGGLQGPLHYDVASFLWQASARYSDELRQAMVEEYLDELATLIEVDREKFKTNLMQFVLFRTLQVLGAYGMLGRFERKPYFIQSTPGALQNLDALIKSGVADAYPHLKQTLIAMLEKEYYKVDATTQMTQKTEGIHVRVFSFSYKKSGIPEDTSGNGGGYVFDCRSTHNPGKYEPYKKLTGLDAPVIQFLEEDGEILQFLESVYKLAEFHVERYMERGFTDLMFSFGCTGGQHRSVYSAQHLAEHLHQKYNIHVTVDHREQGVFQELKPKV